MKDLHIHTKYSDGEYDENEILDKILQKGITEFALCDHDTIEGSKKVFDIVTKNKLNIIFHSGVELSCRVKELFNGINVHLLVRDFDFDDKDILKIVKKISSLRLKKINLMVQLIKKSYNIDINKQKISYLLKTTNSVGKPHLYKLLCEYGNYDREEYYKKMRDLKSENLKLDAVKVLNLLKNKNCIVTLAHPREIMEEYNLNYDDIEKLVKFLKNHGLKGLETQHTSNINDDLTIFSKIAKKYNLMESCGSDYHGPNVKPDVELGKFEKLKKENK